jgi:hypothetical protein
LLGILDGRLRRIKVLAQAFVLECHYEVSVELLYDRRFDGKWIVVEKK